MRRPCEVSKFCSHACYTASRVGTGTKTVTRQCEQCRRTITDSISQIGRFCSKSCANEAKRTDPIARFNTYVDKSGDCWMWTGAVNRYGYGKFWLDGRSINASRAAYELTHGRVDEGLLVCHSCDNPRCVRVDHLFVGTPKANTADMFAKGREWRRPRQRVAIPCARCGTVTETTPAKAKERRYCSRRCATTARWALR